MSLRSLRLCYDSSLPVLIEPSQQLLGRSYQHTHPARNRVSRQHSRKATGAVAVGVAQPERSGGGGGGTGGIVTRRDAHGWRHGRARDAFDGRQRSVRGGREDPVHDDGK